MNRPLLLVAAGLLCAAGAQAQDQTSHFTSADGTQVTVTSGQPAPDRPGTPPPFAQLDSNRDGVISRSEAEAYLPLLNDYDYISFHNRRVTQSVYQTWVQTQGH